MGRNIANIMLCWRPSIIGLQISYLKKKKKKKKPKIIELYICRDRELENTFRNSSNF